jgi:hypothetical protein
MEQMTYAFRQAPLRKNATYQLTDTLLEKWDHTGAPEWQVDLGDVTAAYYGAMKTQVGLSRELILTANDQTFRIYYTAMMPKDDAANGFVPLVRAIGAGLEATQPGFRVGKGMQPRAKFGLFAAFALAVLIGVGILGAMMLNNMGLDDVLTLGVPMLGLIGFGGFGMWMFWPWRKGRGIGAKHLLTQKPKAQ